MLIAHNNRLRDAPQTGASVGAVLGVLVLIAAILACQFWYARKLYRKTPGMYTIQKSILIHIC